MISTAAGRRREKERANLKTRTKLTKQANKAGTCISRSHETCSIQDTRHVAVNPKALPRKRRRFDGCRCSLQLRFTRHHSSLLLRHSFPYLRKHVGALCGDVALLGRITTEVEEQRRLMRFGLGLAVAGLSFDSIRPCGKRRADHNGSRSRGMQAAVWFQTTAARDRCRRA